MKRIAYATIAAMALMSATSALAASGVTAEATPARLVSPAFTVLHVRGEGIAKWKVSFACPAGIEVVRDALVEGEPACGTTLTYGKSSKNGFDVPLVVNNVGTKTGLVRVRVNAYDAKGRVVVARETIRVAPNLK